MNHPWRMQKGPQLVSHFLHPVLTTFSEILLNKGWKSVYKEQWPSNSCLLITHHDSIMETMFQHIVNGLTSLGEITTEHKRSKY